MRTAALICALLLTPALAAAQDAPVATAPEAAVPAPAPTPAPAADAIGDLIHQQSGAEIDEETAETLGTPEPTAMAPPPSPPSPPAAPAPASGYVPTYAKPSPSGLNRPVMIHETGVSPDGPPDVSELTYESRVRGSIAAAQGLQGPLDGAWTLTDASGGKLYAFQMVDPGRGLGDLEGAWRDLRRGDAIGGVGLIAAIEAGGEAGSMTVRFYPRDAGDPVVAQLIPTAGGGWTGTLSEKGVSTPVTLVRDGLQATSYTVLGETTRFAPRPYDSRIYAPASVRKATAKASKGKAKKGKATSRKSTKKKATAKKRRR